MYRTLDLLQSKSCMCVIFVADEDCLYRQHSLNVIFSVFAHQQLNFNAIAHAYIWHLATKHCNNITA